MNNAVERIVSLGCQLLKNKQFIDVVRYLTVSTLPYLAEKFGKTFYKYDPLDYKNMVYRHNLNNDDTIDPKLALQMLPIYNLEKMLLEIIPNSNIHDIFDSYKKVSYDYNTIDKVQSVLREGLGNKLNKFDIDTIETSGLITGDEIQEGKILLPDKSIIVITDEGECIKDIKNDYLEEIASKSNNVSMSDFTKLVNNFHAKNKTKEVIEYFNQYK